MNPSFPNLNSSSIRVPHELVFDSQDSSDSVSSDGVYDDSIDDCEEIIVDVEEIEKIYSKKFSDFDGSLKKFGTLCAIAECEMKMFSN
jgi:hypothetical protein